jgi:hypothetical protein
MRPSITAAVGGLRVLATTLVNGPGHPGVFSIIKFDSQSTHLLYSPQTGLLPSTTTHNIFMDGHSAHTHCDNEYSFHTWKIFHSNLKQVIYNFVYITNAAKS